MWASESPLLPSVRWFAPWQWFAHWQPWKRWALVVVMIIGMYLESLVVVLVANEFGLIPIWAIRPINSFTYPLTMAYRFFPPLSWFYKAQFEIIEQLLGFSL